MELREYWYVIRKRLLIVLFIPIVAALVSGYYVMHKSPLYNVSETLLLDETGMTNGSPDTATYVGVMQSQYFTENVNKETHSTFSMSDVDSINYTFSGRLMTMSISTQNTKYGSDLLNAVASTVSSNTNRLVPGINGGVTINPASSSPVPLHRNRDVILSTVMALISGLGLAFLREYLDMRFKSEVDIVRFLNIPALGSIHEYKLGKRDQKQIL